MCRTRRDCQTGGDDPADVAVREATEADVGGISAIYDREVVIGHATFDTTPPPPETWSAKLASSDPGDHFLVAEDAGRVVGYAYSAPYRTRAAYRHTRETTVYVAADAAGQGLGRRLYDDLLARLRADGVHTVLAGVAQPNAASEGLHRSVGFEPLGVMREVGFKHDRWIDVVWWQLLFR